MSDKQSKKEQEEKLYTDSKGVKCNLRGMMRREPEWLLSRFRFMEQRIKELDRQVKYRYCSKCEKDVLCHEVDHFGFHTCGRFTVPLYSEERRRRFMAEKRIDQLTAEKEKISKLAAVCMVYKQFYSHVRECVDQCCEVDSPVKCKVCDQTFHEITGIRERIVYNQLPGAGKKVCGWKLDETYGDAYDTGCGKMFAITDGTPADNKMKYCPFCGKRISEKKQSEEM